MAAAAVGACEAKLTAETMDEPWSKLNQRILNVHATCGSLAVVASASDSAILTVPLLPPGSAWAGAAPSTRNAGSSAAAAVAATRRARMVTPGDRKTG